MITHTAQTEVVQPQCQPKMWPSSPLTYSHSPSISNLLPNPAHFCFLLNLSTPSNSLHLQHYHPRPRYYFLSPLLLKQPNLSTVIHSGFSQHIFNFKTNMVFPPQGYAFEIRTWPFTNFGLRTKGLSHSLLQGLKQQECKDWWQLGFSQRESQFPVRVKNDTNTGTEAKLRGDSREDSTWETSNTWL